MEDISAVKEELAEKQQALEALQRNFDDFQESSRELEEELEAELGRVSGVGKPVGCLHRTPTAAVKRAACRLLPLLLCLPLCVCCPEDEPPGAVCPQGKE